MTHITSWASIHGLFPARFIMLWFAKLIMLIPPKKFSKTILSQYQVGKKFDLIFVINCIM